MPLSCKHVLCTRNPIVPGPPKRRVVHCRHTHPLPRVEGPNLSTRRTILIIYNIDLKVKVVTPSYLFDFVKKNFVLSGSFRSILYYSCTKIDLPSRVFSFSVTSLSTSSLASPSPLSPSPLSLESRTRGNRWDVPRPRRPLGSSRDGSRTGLLLGDTVHSRLRCLSV